MREVSERDSGVAASESPGSVLMVEVTEEGLRLWRVVELDRGPAEEEKRKVKMPQVRRRKAISTDQKAVVKTRKERMRWLYIIYL